MGVRVKVGFKDSVGVQIGQNFPQGTFGVHGALGALGAHGRLGATPVATNGWPKAPWGGGGGAGVVGVLGPAESPPRVGGWNCDQHLGLVQGAQGIWRKCNTGLLLVGRCNRGPSNCATREAQIAGCEGNPMLKATGSAQNSARCRWM